jgi:hypothetical protein
LTVTVKIIENTNPRLFELEVNVYLKEKSYQIVTYTIGKDLVKVKKGFLRSENIFKHVALFLTDDELPKQSMRRVIPKIDETNTSSPAGKGIL